MLGGFSSIYFFCYKWEILEEKDIRETQYCLQEMYVTELEELSSFLVYTTFWHDFFSIFKNKGKKVTNLLIISARVLFLLFLFSLLKTCEQLY